MYLFYAFVTSLATILGGLLPFSGLFRKIDRRYLIGFASGMMISIAFFEMFPEAGAQNAATIAIGFFSIYIVEKLVMIHTCAEEECEAHTVGWVALIGIAIESLIDGIAIAVGYSVVPALGFTIALAVLVHEIPRGFSTTVIMRNANYGQKAIGFALAVDAGFTPLGAILSGFFPIIIFKNIIAFAAGTFLYVGASDLLPEAHRTFNTRVVLSVVVGAIFPPILRSLI